MIDKSTCYIKPNTALKQIMHEFRDAYNQYVDAFYTLHIKELPAGAILPAKDRIYSDKGKTEFDSMVASKYRELANYIFDNELEKVHKKMTETPDANISAMIGMLATRENVSDEELTHLLEEYGSNHQVYKALQDIGKKHDITILDDAISTRESDLLSLKHSIEKALTINNAQTVGSSYYDFFDIPIDETISD